MCSSYPWPGALTRRDAPARVRSPPTGERPGRGPPPSAARCGTRTLVAEHPGGVRAGTCRPAARRPGPGAARLVADAMARGMVVPPHRDGGQVQVTDTPVARCQDDLPGVVLAWAGAHLAEPISVELLVRRALVSPRSSPAGSRPPPGRRRTPGCRRSGWPPRRRCRRRATPRSRRSPGWSGSAPRPGCASSSPAGAGSPRAPTGRPPGPPGRSRGPQPGRRRCSWTGTGRGLAGCGAARPASRRASVSRRSSTYAGSPSSAVSSGP